MGLHLNVPEAQLDDNATREHVKRVWWSAYLLDHTCTATNGQMVSTHDDQISVDFPSSSSLPGGGNSDFGDSDYISARIQLMRLSRDIVKSLYGRGKCSIPFLQRVQNGLKDLKNWYRSLPETLKLSDRVSSRLIGSVKSLQLFFNQVFKALCVTNVLQ